MQKDHPPDVCLKAEMTGQSYNYCVEITERGFYRIALEIRKASVKGERRFPVKIGDAAFAEILIYENGSFHKEVAFTRNFSSGQYRLHIADAADSVEISGCSVTRVDGPDSSIYEVKPSLITPSPHPNAQRLMNFLCDIYGRHVLTGQQRGEQNSVEIDTVFNATGKYPAVMGFDFISYSSSRASRGETTNQTDEAIRWWNEGGIVTFCWHWNAPKDLVDKPPDKGWNRGFYTYATTFDLEYALSNPESEDYALLLADIDIVAGQLKALEAAGVPVLFRPLHEAAGRWFWWGAKGQKPCLALWKLLYDRLVNHHGLSNLIWVWSGLEREWYPGDEFTDIIGDDVYAGTHIYASQADRFLKCLSMTEGRKIVTLSENGSVPDPDEMMNDNTFWSWFCTWHGIFVCDRKDGSLSEEFTTADMLRKVYDHPIALSRGDLPDLRTYRL